MKKNLFMVAAVALMALVSCNKEEVTNGATEQPQPQEPSVVVEFTASLGDEATKTTLDVENNKTLWLESDKISINGQVFKVKELVDGGASATFVNESELPEGFAAPYTALYPANVTEVPSTQTAYAGKFDPNAVLETATSNNEHLSFKNVTSLLKFQVPAACNSVTITSDDVLAGSDSKTVTISGTMAAGTDYYVAVLPGTKKNFKVSIDSKVSRKAASVTVNRNVIANMGVLPTPADWRMTGGIGTVNMVKSDVYTDLYVAKNVTLNSTNTFCFENNAGDKVVGAYGASGQTVDCKGQINSWYDSDAKDTYAASIYVSQSGSYDVYFSEKDNNFLIIKTGVEEVDSPWEVVGWIKSKDSWGGNSGYTLKHNYITTELSITMDLTTDDYFKFLKGKSWTAGANGGWIGAPGNDGATKNYAPAVGNSLTVNTYHSYDNHKAQFHMSTNGTYKLTVSVSNDPYTSATVKITRVK